MRLKEDLSRGRDRWASVLDAPTAALINRSTDVSDDVIAAVRGGRPVGDAKLEALRRFAALVTRNRGAVSQADVEAFRENNPPGSAGERWYLSAIPMGRFGQPEGVAAAIAFLMSEEAGFITGQTLFVGGGASIGRLPV